MLLNFPGTPKQDQGGEFGKKPLQMPSLSLPKGGGALHGIGEKFAANAVTGTGSLSVPIASSPGRAGFAPQLALTYDSGRGNGPFGFGWHLSLPAITRRTDKGLPQYRDAEESDVFLLSDVEDLVPVLVKVGEQWQRQPATRIIDGVTYQVQQYRPRIEGLFARIERWTDTQTGEIHWHSISKENVTTLYGQENASRIYDQEEAASGHAQRIFAWLICASYDDKGNVIVYEYKAEDGDNVDQTQAHERNRSELSRSANRYLKRIRYGNQPSRLVQPDLKQMNWLFEVVFDYGEHDAERPTPAEVRPWLCRHDPFSTYRSGFEVRAYRLCQRVLMFHHFPNEPTAGQDCLVHSTDFVYQNTRNQLVDLTRGNPLASFLASISHSGYQRQQDGSYLKKSMPPLTFSYSQAVIQQEVREIDAASLENLPVGLDGRAYSWVDLDAEGVSGILTEQAEGWFYKPNLGNGHFGPLERVGSQPSSAALSAGQQLLSLAGDGRLDLVDFAGPVPGFFKRTEDQGWENFAAFPALPRIEWWDANLRLVDLDGDGLVDVLITEHDVLVWHQSLAEEGFGPAQYVSKPFDEELGPTLVFTDGTQSIYLADMAGDGLNDLVRVRNGEVCYWPNLGYGRFGKKVAMDDAPWFTTTELFDERRVRLADIDGSGTTDLIYVGDDAVQVYFNQAGNRWSAQQTLSPLPHLDTLAAVMTVDLLGNGTACLVWSSPLPGDGRQPLRYIDLMGGQKPHLLIGYQNNLGAETLIQYASSTSFYLADKQAGQPWVTRLPFPVHVVEQVEHLDHISGTRFVTRYAYHHGYFDSFEREFRGFGMVEQQDTEAFEDYVVGVQQQNGTQTLEPELYQPPVTTRTWFHTGALLSRDVVLHQLWSEYYQQKAYLPEPQVPAGLNEQEYRECLRALKGLPLRQEVYSFDGSPQEQVPYNVVEYDYGLTLFQPCVTQKHAVFLVSGTESITHYFERNPADPRIAHSFNLEFDQYGNVLRSAAIVYGRVNADPTLPSEVTRDQEALFITYSEVDYTTDLDQFNPIEVYRLRVPCESREYEITGLRPASDLFLWQEIKEKIAGATDISYETVATGPGVQRRLLSRSRTLFADNNLAPLPLGQMDTLGLVYERYQLAFTPGVVSAYYTGQVADSDFTQAGYVHFNGDMNWWIPSGTALYPTDPAAHFYLPDGGKDALGLETIATFDKYDLLVEQVQVKQAAWKTVRATNDYRVLGPVMTTDPNGNRSAVEIDVLGIVVKSALMGKEGAGEGDTLDDPTTRMEYDVFNWMNNGKPAYIHTFAREQHGAANPRWQESYTYSNGAGGIAQVKAQAHPGKALQVNPDGTTTEVDANPRWVGNGRTVLNNKGKPVKRYEPFFSTTSDYENEKALREIGSTPILYYDAPGRNIRTLSPNGTFGRVEIGAWMQRLFDANDTLKQSQWYIDRGSPDPTSQPEPVNDPERRAAWLAAKHADTPGTLHFSSLGRPIYAISDYGGGKTSSVRSESDLTGRYSYMFDQKQRLVASDFKGMAGTAIFSSSAEKGRRWMLPNVLGALVKTWDEHGRVLSAEYDELHRPVSSYVQEPGQARVLFNYAVYGDRSPNAQQLNLLGASHQIFDQAGMTRVPGLDFQGNPTSVQRVLAKDYQHVLDWSTVQSQPDYASIQTAAEPALEMTEIFTASATFDALNRPTGVTLPDGSLIQPTYNEANFLASLQAQVRGQGTFIEFLKEQDYDAKGQRQFAHYGNDVFTRYFYDPKTFRLTDLLTYASGDDPASQGLQNLLYTYDPVGNITQVQDTAQQTHYFHNAVVRPEGLYEYDALYQLIKATGREFAGLTNDVIPDNQDLAFVSQLPHVNDAAAVRNYVEIYEYDLLGNITKMQHSTAGATGNWTQHYHYAYDEDPTDFTNRLLASSLPGDPDAGPYTASYSYDAYGNMTSMPHLASLSWNFLDQLQRVDLGGGGTAYYVYDSGGQRVRKVLERQGSLRVERIYLGAVEIYRERVGIGDPRLERYTLHVSDNTGRIAQVDTKTIDTNNSDPANALNTPLIRYQYTNHLGSAVLETDASGQVISYEEYHPYGTSAYRSARSGFDLSLKRYRFSGKERDDETGLYYFGARYYAAWLGRWTSSDPAGFADGMNLYHYCRNSPLMHKDYHGMQTGDPQGVTLVEKKYFTGQETLSQLKALPLPAGTKLNPEITEENLKNYYIPGKGKGGAGGIWNILIPDAGVNNQGDAGSSDAGSKDASSSNASDQGSASTGGNDGGSAPDSQQKKEDNPPTSNTSSTQGGKSSDGTPGSAVPYAASELSTAGAVRALDALKKANLGKVVEKLLANNEILDNVQRISKGASEARQALRAADQSSGGILNRVVSRLIDKNSTKTWSDFVNKALGGRKGEEALQEAYTTVARNSAIGRESANTLGMASRAFGGALGVVGAVLSGYSLQENLSKGHWFDAFVDATSFVSSGLAVGAAITGSVALGEAGLVIGAFGVGVLIGTGIDKGTEWASKKLFGVDLSPSSIISQELTTIDQMLTPLWADPSKPAYTQTLGWKLADWLGI